MVVWEKWLFVLRWKYSAIFLRVANHAVLTSQPCGIGKYCTPNNYMKYRDITVILSSMWPDCLGIQPLKNFIIITTFNSFSLLYGSHIKQFMDVI